ncbi:MAG: FecR domain-containing protein [Myxococcota bacterium]
MNDWIKQATESTEDEVARMNPGLSQAVNLGIRLDTSSSDDEVHALQRRLRQLEHSGGRAGLWWKPALLGGTALVAVTAAVAGVFVAPQVLNPVVEAGPTAMLLRPGSPQTLGPSIVVDGLGELSVERLHDQGADVLLVDGVAEFEVDPRGTARQLVVTAADVDVRVMGTVFTVQRLGDEVAVGVTRGKVGVTWRGEQIFLTAGQTWRKGEGIASASPVPMAPLVATAPAPSLDAELAVVVDAEPGARIAPTVGPDVRSMPVVSSQGVGARPAAPSRASTAAPDGAIAEPNAALVTAPIASPDADSDPCASDPFSDACRQARRPSREAQSPKSRYEALLKAQSRLGSSGRTARQVVQDCNTFIDQHRDTEYAADVYAIRVEAAFFGERASQVVKYADAYLASVDGSHHRRSDVRRFRDVANLRQGALDAAQKGDYADALPLFRDLIGMESGTRREEAKAWRGICADAVGRQDEARQVLSTLREEVLPVALRSRVREVWVGLTDAPRELVQDPG